MADSGAGPVRDVEPLVRPRIVAVIGASSSRRTQGNGVIRNLQETGFPGRIIPVHPMAGTIDGLPSVRTIGTLPPGVDTAILAIPAPGVPAVLAELAAAQVRSAIVFSNGFAAADEAAFRRFAATTPMLIHGPNCMGLINVTDGTRLYPSTVTSRVTAGPVALIAQSGSAAISLMNSVGAGLSKVVTMGSEFQLAAPDYMRWLAADPATRVVGIVLESIRDPAEFEAAVAALHTAGKPVIVLKVGRHAVSARAVQAHTGALISPQDAYDCFLRRCGAVTVGDYEEMAASLEAFATSRATPRGSRIAVIGISGGETALACDVAAELGLPLAAWSAATAETVRSALPGASGRNPLDLGATVHHTVEQDALAVDAILDDPGVDAVLLVQDAQGTLTPTMLGNYTPRIQSYGRHAQRTGKPVVLVSPTAENTHPQIQAELSGQGLPVLRGLRAGIVALRNLGQPRHAPAPPPVRRTARPDIDLSGLSGPLPHNVCTRLLAAYGIPFVKSVVVASAEAAIAAAESIGYPLVVKVSSRDVAHRSDVGGVVLGVGNAADLQAAIARITRAVSTALPGVAIDGFELQEELAGHVEAVAGFIAAAPFGALTMVGLGGTLVELMADRAVALSPVAPPDARDMVGRTRLGALLGGYRNLLPETRLDGLADLVAGLSELAADFAPFIAECDLNPVLIRRGSGEVWVADVLMTGHEAASV